MFPFPLRLLLLVLHIQEISQTNKTHHDLSAGAVSAGWSVTFENPNPCAIKGSSVEFRCSYNYSDGGTVRKTAWSKGELKDGRWKRVALSDLLSYQNRSEYLGDLQHDCSLAIHDLQDNDTGYYYFRFDTDMYGWRSRSSVYLTVTGIERYSSSLIISAFLNIMVSVSLTA